MESAPYAMMERVALDGASQALRPELFARITERIVFRPLGLEVQKNIVEMLIEAKVELLPRYFGMELSVDIGPVRAFLIRVGYSKSQGARRLRQEVDRQFNLASLNRALNSTRPSAREILLRSRLRVPGLEMKAPKRPEKTLTSSMCINRRSSQLINLLRRRNEHRTGSA